MEKFRAGADLLQLITGMIFEGPHLMKEICQAYCKSGLHWKKQVIAKKEAALEI
jgi:dihydroorotate dehydrogenase